MGTKFKNLAFHLETLPDPRKVNGRRHVLLDILIIAVLAALCGIDFSEAFLAWVGGIREKIPEDAVALDGKTLRASLSRGKPPLHVVSA